MVIIHSKRINIRSQILLPPLSAESKLWSNGWPKTIYIHQMESHRHWIEINQQKLHYQQAGAGSPVVLAHGLLADRSAGGSTFPRYLGRTQFLRLIARLWPSRRLAGTDCGMQAQALRLHGLNRAVAT